MAYAVPLGRVEVGVASRAALIWLGVRAVVGVLLLLGGSSPIAVGPRTAMFIALTAVVAGVVDVGRRREHVLLANLGTGPAVVVALVAAPVVLLEILLAVLT